MKQASLPIAIIGGGIASASLCLSLATRGKSISLFCKDNRAAQGASGNKQGALYPLLTPDNNALSRFFQQGFFYTIQKINYLCNEGYDIAHDFCGVLQTPVNEKNHDHLRNILNYPKWPQGLIEEIQAQDINKLAGIKINKSGVYYPSGGWVCPQDLTKAQLAKAASLTELKQHYRCNILKLNHKNTHWYLTTATQEYGPFEQVVLANGANMTDFSQTAKLPLTPFRGQVSHIPTTRKLQNINTVLCCDGYFTPSLHNQHCLGASYIKVNDSNNRDLNLKYNHSEQIANAAKFSNSYPDSSLINDIDISGKSARVGIRMVSRDHFPVMGEAPDTEAIYQLFNHNFKRGDKNANQSFWANQTIPSHKGLYLLGGLGSRGISSGPLISECLAAELCHEEPILEQNILDNLNPNRYWLNKLLKGKEI